MLVFKRCVAHEHSPLHGRCRQVKERGGLMTRSRDNTRFNRYLAKKHRQALRGSISSLRTDTVQPVDFSGRLMERAIKLDQRLDVFAEEEPVF